MASSHKPLPVVLVLLAFLAAPSMAQEWTRFRGPNGSGISNAKTVPVTFTEQDYNWRVALPGVGHSSPVVWKEKIFVTSADEASGKRTLFCLSAADGKIRWSRPFDFAAYRKHEFNNSASSTPAVDADHVYVVWPTPDAVILYALNHDGEPVWKRDLGPYQSQHGGGMSPIVAADLVVVAKEQDGQGEIFAVDRKRGEIRWKQEHANKNAAYSTPLVYEPAGGPPQLVFTSNAGITSLDPKNGALVWEVPGVFIARCVGSPVLANGMVFATAGDGGGSRQAAAVRPGDKGRPARIAWQPAKGISYVPTPIAFGDRLYLWGDGGVVTCLKIDSGQEVWMERAGGRYFGSPVCIDGKLYAVSDQGEVVVIATGDEFKILGRSNLGEPSHATPAVAGGIMYLRTEKHLVSVGGKNP